MGTSTSPLGVPKDHSNPRYDTDENGAIDQVDESVLNADTLWDVLKDKYKQETGTFSAVGTTKVTLSVEYDFILGATIGLDEDITHWSDNGISSFTTDNDGNITEVTFRTEAQYGTRYKWWIWGIKT